VALILDSLLLVSALSLPPLKNT